MPNALKIYDSEFIGAYNLSCLNHCRAFMSHSSINTYRCTSSILIIKIQGVELNASSERIFGLGSNAINMRSVVYKFFFDRYI